MSRAVGGMSGEYSDRAGRLTLAVDTGSPVTSVALADGEHLLAARSLATARSSNSLLSMIDAVLEETGAERRSLGRLAALAARFA